MTGLHIKADRRNEFISFESILYIQARKQYIMIVTTERRWMSIYTLKSIEKVVPHGMFTRVHRSYIVAIDKVKSFDGEKIVIGSHQVPVSFRLRKRITAIFTQKNASDFW